MKKTVFILFLIIVIIPVTALAADDVSVQNDFFTWESLLTYAGCLAATLIFTQLLKNIWPAAWPTQILSYVIALLTLIAANWILGKLNWNSALLSIFNAGIVSLAANGGFNNIKEVKEAISKKAADNNTTDNNTSK